MSGYALTGFDASFIVAPVTTGYVLTGFDVGFVIAGEVQPQPQPPQSVGGGAPGVTRRPHRRLRTIHKLNVAGGRYKLTGFAATFVVVEAPEPQVAAPLPILIPETPISAPVEPRVVTKSRRRLVTKPQRQRDVAMPQITEPQFPIAVPSIHEDSVEVSSVGFAGESDEEFLLVLLEAV